MSRPLVLFLVLCVAIVISYLNAHFNRKNGYRFDKTFVFTLIALIALAYFILKFIGF
jgi:hypothetical protein